MHSKKEYEAKIKKLELKIEKLIKKLEDLEEKRRIRSKELSYLRSEIKRLKQSRDNWKAKYKSKQEALKKSIKASTRAGKAKWHHYPIWLVTLCILLRLAGNCSYKGAEIIIKLLNEYLELGLVKTPCANSIQNWVSKLGLYVLQLGKTPYITGQKVCIIVDESIRLGQEKLLLLLSVPYNKVGKMALCYEDVKVVYMKGAISWTGEKIGQIIKNLEQSHKLKVAYVLSDEDSKLMKACELADTSHVPDISHGVATCLRRVFDKAIDFTTFKKLVSSYSSRGVNQSLSYLCPPKQRTKARFMNIGKVINWANRMLENFKKLNEKEQSFFNGLLEQASFIEVLQSCLRLAQAVSLPFKQEGLSEQTLAQAQQEIEAIKNPKGYLNDFIQELKGYIARYQKIVKRFKNIRVHASSEVIESLFGKYKSKANNYALTGLTMLNLELPLYGLSIEEIKLHTKQALQDISIKELAEWKVSHSTDNQIIKRNNVFKKKK